MVAMAATVAATVAVTAGWAPCMAAMAAPCMGPAPGEFMVSADMNITMLHGSFIVMRLG